MIRKKFITPSSLLLDSFRLASKIFLSGFIPDVILVMWRGGTPVGIVVHEFFLYKGIRTYHTVVKAESYTGIEKRIKPVIENLPTVLENIPRNSRVLIVDDIFDTGQTLSAVCKTLRRKTRLIKTAALYYRKRKDCRTTPDFFIRKADRWIVFPHELEGLNRRELLKKSKTIFRIIQRR